MFSTAGNTHQAWKDREAAQAAAGFYNDSSVDLTPRDAIEPCYICGGTGGRKINALHYHCTACNGKGTVWVETVQVLAAWDGRTS